MSSFDGLTRIFLKPGVWAFPFLSIGISSYFYFALRGDNRVVTVVGSSFLTIIGLQLMFRQFASDTKILEPDRIGTEDNDATYVVRQLSRNFEILRSQTNQGFLLSGVFMAFGILILIGSIFTSSLGLKTEGISSLGIIAGVVTEFISGTALLLYRLNFERLNQTSDRLDDAWRVLAAYKLTSELPDEKKADATIRLIISLTTQSNNTRKESTPSS